MAHDTSKRAYRINDVYYSRASDPLTRRVLRRRIHWMSQQASCKQVLGSCTLAAGTVLTVVSAARH